MLKLVLGRGLLFAAITFTLMTIINALRAGGVTMPILVNAAITAGIAAAAYTAIRALIAWVNN